MLTKLLKLLEQNQGELNLLAISQQLQAQPSAVAGMVEMLVRKGRLVEMGPTCGICESCNISSQCNLRAPRVKRFVVAKPDAVIAPGS